MKEFTHEKAQNPNPQNLIEPMEFFSPLPKEVKESCISTPGDEHPNPEKQLYSPMFFYSSAEEAQQAVAEEEAFRKSMERFKRGLSVQASIERIPVSSPPVSNVVNSTEVKPKEDPQSSKMILSNSYTPYHNGRTKPLSHAPSDYEVYKMIMNGAFCFICEESLYVFNSKFYQKRSEKEVQRTIKTFLEHAPNPQIKTRRISEIVRLIYLEEKIMKNAEELNQNEIAFENGVLNIRTGEFYQHSPASLVTYLIKCNYVPGAQPYCPRFQRFLQEITGGDEKLQIRILEMIGYILSPDTGAKVIFLLQGISGSGKSVLVELIKSFFSEESVMPIDVNNLGARFIASSLVGKALAISADMTSAPLKANAVSKLKQFSGGDYVSAEVRYNPLVSFYNRSKFVLVSNHPLLTVEQDDAFVERIVTIPFEYTTPPELRDRTLINQLKAERDGIATLAMAHYFNLVKRNYLFTGNYPLNASNGILQNGGEDCRIEANAFKFLARFFEPSITEGIFTEDAYSLFIREYGYADIKVFSNHFARIAEELFNAEKIRRRRTSDGNPISYIKGIKLKGGL